MIRRGGIVIALAVACGLAACAASPAPEALGPDARFGVIRTVAVYENPRAAYWAIAYRQVDPATNALLGPETRVVARFVHGRRVDRKALFGGGRTLDGSMIVDDPAAANVADVAAAPGRYALESIVEAVRFSDIETRIAPQNAPHVDVRAGEIANAPPLAFAGPADGEGPALIIYAE